MTVETLRVIWSVLLGAAAVTGTLGWLAYTVMATWWTTQAGRFVWVHSLYLALLMDYLAAVTFRWLPSGDAPVRAWVAMAVFGGALLVTTWFLVLVVHAQVQVRKAKPGLLARQRTETTNTKGPSDASA